MRVQRIVLLVTLLSGMGLGHSCWAQPTVYTDEQAYLNALANLGVVQRSDGFENDNYWGLLETDTAPDVTSKGITWSALGGGVRLNHGIRNTGSWGLAPSPPATPVNGFTGANTGPQTMYGFGGWVRSGNTSDIFLYLNGSSTSIHDAGVGSTYTFMGVIDPGGIQSFQFATEAVAPGDPAKEIYLDKFTFGFDVAPPVRDPGIEWASGGGGTYGNGANWTGGAMPTSANNARFDLGSASPYTVNFAQNRTASQAIVGNDQVTFDLGTHQFDLTQTNITRESLIVGEIGGDSGIASIENGTVMGANVVVAHSSGSNGQLTLQNGGNLSLSGAMRIGSGGTGTLNVLGGSQVSSNRGIIGQLNGTGVANIDGPGAQWTVPFTSRLDIGLGGTGTLNVTNAASVSAGAVSLGRKAGNGLPNEPTGAGTLNVSGGGTTLSFSTLDVAVDGAGSATISAGAQATGSNIFLGTGTNASMTVDGAGSLLKANIGGASRGTLVVGRGNTLRANNNSNVHTTVLNITGGGLVESEETYIGSDNLNGVSNGDGVININGVGSTWRSTQNTFIGYHANGTVNVTNGGMAETGQTFIGRFTSVNAHTGFGTRGIVNVDGTGSQFLSNTSIWVGLPNDSGFYSPGSYQSEGILNVSNGGQVQTAVGLMLADRKKASGIVNIDGAGSEITTGFVYLGNPSTSTTAYDSSASLSISNGSTLNVLGFDDGGGGPLRYIDINHGNIDLDGGAIHSAELNIYGGSLIPHNDPSLIGDDSATLTGVGLIFGDVKNWGGTIAPGHSAGTLQIDGNLTQAIDGMLAMEIGGFQQGSEYDFMDVSGTATLNGLLDVSLINGFSPLAGDTFDVLTAASIDPTGLALSGVPGFSWSVVSGGNGQILRLSASAIPEPSALGVCMVVGLFALLRRRRS